MCGGQICTVQEICCGPAECPRCMNIPSTLCPTTCGGTGGGSAGRGGMGGAAGSVALVDRQDQQAEADRPDRRGEVERAADRPAVAGRAEARAAPAVASPVRATPTARDSSAAVDSASTPATTSSIAEPAATPARGTAPTAPTARVGARWPCTPTGSACNVGYDLLRRKLLHRHADLLHGDARPVGDGVLRAGQRDVPHRLRELQLRRTDDADRDARRRSTDC